ncbi:Hypothetical Protein FCC1311_002762 [Hondaea fermentalgiana]|uniref:Uncharacterized protein n=1 Tax=Hondaea fermentalgiana TaxID=2315210 RepID=A0A2R5G2V5_9STRA|nr:Hypothetical Protein FCC1311_002762 [Hondaea fermentalgiana]|eukprot:GBG24058.1 Hypothetical Protein FCC1311_002762 [Hondaea fermentalgiana]
MTDADARRKQLEAWRNARKGKGGPVKGQKLGKTITSDATATAPATSTNNASSGEAVPTKKATATASTSSTSSKLGARTSVTKTAPKETRETSKNATSSLSSSSSSPPRPYAKPTLTPTRLRFAETSKPEQTTALPPGASSTTQIRAKLAASAKKRKRALDERKSRVEAMTSARKLRKVAEEQAASAQVVKKDTQKHLENMVHEQVDLAESMIKCKKYDDARGLLKTLSTEIPSSLAVGAFWMTLVKIETALGNRVRTGSIYAHALRHCAAEEVREACAEFLESELFPPSMSTKWTLADLLSDAELAVPTSDDPLEAYLSFNPDTVQKPPRRALGSVNSAAPGSISRLGSALRSGAKRIPVKFQEDSILETDETSSPVGRSSARKGARLSQSLSQNAPAGSIVAVASVKNKPSKASLLGSEVSMTPVRRSARLQKTPSSQADVLRASNFSYTPNPQFDLSALR